MESLKDAVAVVGAGTTRFGEHHGRGWEDLAAEAVSAALADAGAAPDAIEAAWLGTYSPHAGAGKAAVSLADAAGLWGKPITRVENYCATGTDAFRQAAMAVAAGIYETVLVAGVEKLRDRPQRGLGWDAAHPYRDSGLTAPGCFALPAAHYLKTYGAGREALARVAVKNHRHGARNEKAHFRREITEAEALAAPIIAWPFGLLDCCPTTDGAAALVLTRAARARSFPSTPALLKGLGLAVTSGRPWYDPANDFLGFASTRAAAREAYRMAGIGPRDIDVAEVHDCFTWTEIVNYEDLGFCGRGEGFHFVAEGRSALGGELPVNPSGGLKSCGHPIGASGVRMIAEIVAQLRGHGGARQVPGAQLGLAHNLGGPGAVACVVVLGNG